MNFEITPQIESQIITQMAQTLVSNNWENKTRTPKELLRSEHFYDVKLLDLTLKARMSLYLACLTLPFHFLILE